MKAKIVQPRLQRGFACNQIHNFNFQFSDLIKLFCVLEDDIRYVEAE